MDRRIPILALILAFRAAHAQPAESKPAFEVSTIKPAVPFRGTGVFHFGASGGPGTRDPGRYTCDHCSLSDLIIQAYGLKRFQLSGPDWLPSEYFDVVAKVPEGATKDQMKLMLQNLLVERFQLASHSEQRDTPIYELAVSRNGPKLTPHVDPPAGAEPDPPPAPGSTGYTLDPKGYPVLPPGRSGSMIVDGRSTMRRVNESMGQLAAILSNAVGRPVIDATGLKGTYDFTLFYTLAARAMPAPPPADGNAPGPSLPEGDTGLTVFAAIQQQLGLKLEPKKGATDVLVVDHIAKAPTGN